MQEVCTWQMEGYYPDYKEVNAKFEQIQFICDEMSLPEPVLDIHIYSWGTRIAIASDAIVLNYVEPVHYSDFEEA